MDDVEAVTLLQSGDISALEVLVARYQVQATRAAYLITRSAPAAQDIVQDAFLRVYERIDQFDTARPFGPWFLRIVVNDALKAAAKRKREVSLDAADAKRKAVLTIAEPGPGAEDLFDRIETSQMIADALARLSPYQRAAVVLRYYLCLPEVAIAERLGCAPGTVKWHLHVARDRLTALLGALRSS